MDLDTEIQHEENLFLDDITAFMFKEQTKFADRSEDAFRLFLEKVIHVFFLKAFLSYIALATEEKKIKIGRKRAIF